MSTTLDTCCLKVSNLSSPEIHMMFSHGFSLFSEIDSYSVGITIAIYTHRSCRAEKLERFMVNFDDKALGQSMIYVSCVYVPC